MAPLKIGLAGFGTVGSGVWKNLHLQADLIEQRCGRQIQIAQITTRTPSKATEAGVSPSLLATDWKALVENPEIEVIVELMGGISESAELIRASLRAGKHVVTANKALLAELGSELFKLAATHQRRILFEASVAGGIPIIKSLQEGLAANRILALHGIINGTCNYMLTRMSESGLSYQQALVEAKELGYAEADERLDVEGHDTAHKACVLARLAYGFWPVLSEVHVEGIVGLDDRDIAFADKLGYTVKLIAVIKAGQHQQAEVRVHPTLLPHKHVLSSISGVYNGIMVRGNVVGDTLFYGRGAGGDPTSSAVISDLMELARGQVGQNPTCTIETAIRLKPMEEVISRYYLRLMVEDRPGVLAEVATVLGAHQIGISSVIQPESPVGEFIPLILMVHDAQEKTFCAAKKAIEGLSIVKAPAVCLRVEDFG